jgi:hypothetical protein
VVEVKLKGRLRFVALFFFKISTVGFSGVEDRVEPIVRRARRKKFADTWRMFVENRTEGRVECEGERRNWRGLVIKIDEAMSDLKWSILIEFIRRKE